MHSSLDASDAERRRIARDLHAGVVQALAGTAFSVSAVSQNPALPDGAQHRLDEAGKSVRRGMKALRSLLVEISPPELHAEGLADALADLIAPAAAAGVQASVSVEGAETVTDERAPWSGAWPRRWSATRSGTRTPRRSRSAVTGAD